MISCGPANCDAMRTVPSLELFTTTWMTSGTRVWANSDVSTSPIDSSSLYAGMMHPIVERCTVAFSSTAANSSLSKCELKWSSE